MYKRFDGSLFLPHSPTRSPPPDGPHKAPPSRQEHPTPRIPSDPPRTPPPPPRPPPPPKSSQLGTSNIAPARTATPTWQLPGCWGHCPPTGPDHGDCNTHVTFLCTAWTQSAQLAHWAAEWVWAALRRLRPSKAQWNTPLFLARSLRSKSPRKELARDEHTWFRKHRERHPLSQHTYNACLGDRGRL